MLDDQIRAEWKRYYTAIAAGNVAEAKRIFDRVSNLCSVQLNRKTTARIIKAMPWAT